MSSGRLSTLALAGAVALVLTGCTSPAHRSTAASPPTRPGTVAPRSAPPTPGPTGSVELGVIDSRDSPLATIRFLAQNHWDGYIHGVYVGVFAGIDRHPDAAGPPTAAVAVFRYPDARTVGMFHSGTGSTPLKILSATGDVLTLSDGRRHPIRFTVSSQRFSAAP